MLSFHQKITDNPKKDVNILRNTGQNNLGFYGLHNTNIGVLKDFNFHQLSSVSSYSASSQYLQANSLTAKKYSIFFENAQHPRKSHISILPSKIMNNGLFGKKETSVYMTLSDKFCYLRQSSGTQATASINKCFQVYIEWKKPSMSVMDSNSDYCSTCTMSSLPYRDNRNCVPEKMFNPEVYFFGRKQEDKQKGMGSKSQKSNLEKSVSAKSDQKQNIKISSTDEKKAGSDASIKKPKPNSPSKTSKGAAISTGAKHDVKKINSKSSIQSSSVTNEKSPSSEVSVSKPKPNLPTKTSKGAATASGTSKTVTIKDDKVQKPCPAVGTTKEDMMMTVSHIKIGPRDKCPVHGSEPCQGPKCILASSGEEQGPVKVTTVNNPRRGVFEIVIRKLTGAPLAKNELMLEWTPPPPRPTPYNTTCPITYITPSSCRHSKCKLIGCRPPSPCRPKCPKRIPCAQTPCRSKPCKKCCKISCSRNPCFVCKPCYSRKPPCRSPSPCKNPCNPPCARTQCTTPCKSSPCLRLCPVGRKRTRKSHSQPRIKSHRKRLSPCYNRSKVCPVVRCRSVPGPCSACCIKRPICLPRKCYSVLPCKPPKTYGKGQAFNFISFQNSIPMLYSASPPSYSTSFKQYAAGCWADALW
ncbi:unnamed protein product, partial [Brenthis ino]